MQTEEMNSLNWAIARTQSGHQEVHALRPSVHHFSFTSLTKARFGASPEEK
jgi:hypothetical protein